MFRVSRKKIKELCDLLDYNLIINQYLGDRKNYFYDYTVVNSNRDVVYRQLSLHQLYNLLSEELAQSVERRINQ